MRDQQTDTWNFPEIFTLFDTSAPFLDSSLTPQGSMNCNDCLNPNIGHLLISFMSPRLLISVFALLVSLSKLQPLESLLLAVCLRIAYKKKERKKKVQTNKQIK